jgi:hypothetical protein
MDPKELRGLYEAYSEVYAPQQIDENRKTARDPEGSERRKTYSKQPDPSKAGFTGIGNMSIDQIRKMSARIEKNQKEELDIFDVVLEFLQAEGFAETLEEAEWLMANVIDEEAIDIILDEASYSAKEARAGKDIGKPGKAFAKIAASAGKRYGSKERGEKVAGAVLAKLRAKRG